MIRPQYHFRKTGDHVHIWEVRRLAKQAEDLPVLDWPLSQIAEIDEPYWFGDTSDVPTCRAVMNHATQMHAADLQYPILLCAAGRVMDGMHRVMKALGHGHHTIKARQLPVTPPPEAPALGDHRRCTL